MTEVLYLRDFPPFVRFDLEERFRRKIFAEFLSRVGKAELGILSAEFWTAVEAELARSRYELIFGPVRGGILRTLEREPLYAVEVVRRNPDLSPYSLYHAIIWLYEHGLIRKKNGRWACNPGYFEQIRIADFAKILDLRNGGMRRRNALTRKELEMAAYLWSHYEHARAHLGADLHATTYGRWYPNHFALARAAKEWVKGAINIPQWALIAIADLAGLELEQGEVIVSYSLPPGAKISPYYKGRYKIPIELSPEFDVIALQLLLRTAEDGLLHPAKDRKALYKRLYHTFGTFQSTRVPLSIRAIVEHYYHVSGATRSTFRIPERMKARWQTLRTDERRIAQILVLEMLFELDQAKRTHEVIARSRGFLEDVAAIIHELGLGELRIHKRRDRPHYRAYLPKQVKENLLDLKARIGTAKIDRGLDLLTEAERAAFITLVTHRWGQRGVEIISNLSVTDGIRDLDLARASGVTPYEVRKVLYELKTRAIITDIREETRGLVEYYYCLNPEGIKRVLTEDHAAPRERTEEHAYPFPEQFVQYQRRRLFSAAK
jgi:hypothetical protein